MIRRGQNLYLVGINRSNLARSDDFNDCENFSQATSVSIYKDWILKTIQENNAELPTFVSETKSDGSNPESICSIKLTQAYSMYSNLYRAERELCAGTRNADISTFLGGVMDECSKICANVKGFKGACEFIARGTEKMVEHHKNKCAEIIF